MIANEKDADFSGRLEFQTNNGNEYVFCPDTCLVFEKNKLYQGRDRLNLWSETYKILPELEPGRKNKTTTDLQEIKRYLFQYGYNELILETTTNCNLRCKYCVFSGAYTGQRDHSNKKMSVTTAFKAIETYLTLFKESQKYNPYKKPSIAFYGGEPLLNFELIRECVYYIKNFYKDKIFMTLTTNGTLMTDEIIDFLIREELYVIFSLDGPEEIHNKNRVFANGSGTFDKVMENIHKIQQKTGRPVYVNSVYDYETDMETLAAFFEGHPELINLSISPVNPYNTSYYQKFNETCVNRFRSKEKKLKEKFLKEIVKKECTNKKSYINFLSQYIGKPATTAIMRPILQTEVNKPIKYTGACIPGDKLMVDTEGYFYPCEKIDRSAKIGCVKEGLDFDLILKFIEEYNDKIASTCSACPVRKVCGYCYNSFIKDGKFIKEPKKCQTMIDSFQNNLSLAYSILEEDPAWFDNFTTAYYEELREMAVRLK